MQKPQIQGLWHQLSQESVKIWGEGFLPPPMGKVPEGAGTNTGCFSLPKGSWGDDLTPQASVSTSVK